MHKWLLCVFILGVTGDALAQEKILPEEATKFLLPGYEMLDYIRGDLNNDKIEDAILVLKQQGEDTSNSDTNRPLLILIRQPNGQLKKAVQNDSAILCFQCGGIFGDPYENITIANHGFEINFYGGSSWRWSYQYSFVFNAAKNNWFLIRQHEANYHNTEIDETMKELAIEKDELGNISIDSFNCNAGFTETKWKVIAAKTFFYTNPNLKSKPRKAYLLKGDIVSSYRQFKNFVEVDFENKKEKSSSGFILKKDLIKIKAN